jgi:hypothetical protein
MAAFFFMFSGGVSFYLLNSSGRFAIRGNPPRLAFREHLALAA